MALDKSTKFSQVKGPLMLRNPKNVNEVFLFELRRRVSYDANVADEGLVVSMCPTRGPFGNPVYLSVTGKHDHWHPGWR